MLFVATGCATAERGRTDALERLAAPGPHPVAEAEVRWFDARRQRTIPARIYFPDDASDHLPVIVFSHGLGNSRRGYSYLGKQWASCGFVSIHPEHPGANEDVAKHGLLHLYRAGFDKRNWSNVPEDISFVIDAIQDDANLPPRLRGRLDRTRIGVAGHSIGAYAALAIGGMRVRFPDGRTVSFRDRRVRAAIPISMSENLPPGGYRDVSIPMLHITGTRDSSLFYGTTPRMRRIPYESIPRTDQLLVTIRGANHSTFSDEESPSNRDAHDVIRAATTLFWKMTLEGDAQAAASLQGGELASAAGSLATVEKKK